MVLFPGGPDVELALGSGFSEGKTVILAAFPRGNTFFRGKNAKKVIFDAFFFGQRPGNGYTLRSFG
ncbi:hypothetical protein AZI86_16745 [Bdellovibrio bacteriovorus]|uniref:Uncharacterized protein n=1 Tax=Bdellovibrio bacteriovorus TaxID=959 RepID=A0A150WHM6_BDEBC|nr:hypothetical protein AZI86_16745 [Bdellovibrio bacteriovorus]